MAITAQEAWLVRAGIPVEVPDFMAEVVERIAFEARVDKRIDNRSGVSQRLPISVIENVVSSAERRAIVNRENRAVPRISDIYAALPSITGKIELEYEGELQGGARPSRATSCGGRLLATFEARAGGAECDDIVNWFDEGGALKVGGDERADRSCRASPPSPGCMDLVQQTGLAGAERSGAAGRRL
jgi:magnesium chelatase subunit I